MCSKISEAGLEDIIRKWQRAVLSGDYLGYPAKSVLWKMIKYGPMGASQKGSTPPDEDHLDVTHMVRALEVLKLNNQLIHDAFLLRYIDRHKGQTVRLKTMAQKARYLGIGRDAMRDRLTAARSELRKILHTLLK